MESLSILLLIFIFIFVLLNVTYKRTNHYKNRLHRIEHLMDVPMDLDVVNLGSSYSYFAYDYELAGVRNGYNLAVYPQYLGGDLQVLKNFRSHLKAGAVVLINISCLVFGTPMGNRHSQDKYYGILEPQNITGYSFPRFILTTVFPLLGNFKLIKYLFKDCELDKYDGIMDDANKLCNARVTSVCKEFGLKDLKDASQFEDLKQTAGECQEILKKIVNICIENLFRPIVVIPPVSIELSDTMSDEFFKAFIMDNIEEAVPEVLVLNYWNDIYFKKSEYFMDPLWLNQQGRVSFTKRLFRDLKLRGINLG